MTHRLQQEQDEANKQKKELEEAQAQLLKLQLIEARNKAGKKKKEVKESTKKMMVARPQPDPVPEWPDLDPNLYPDDRWPINAPRQRQPAGNWGAIGPQGEDKGLVVRGIPVTRVGVVVSDVELTDTGLGNVLDWPKTTTNSEATKPRHEELPEKEVASGEHTKLQAQIQCQSPNFQWQTGPVRGSSTD